MAVLPEQGSPARADDLDRALQHATSGAKRLQRLTSSRRLRSRTEHHGVIRHEDAQAAGLRGPCGRASGLVDDTRSADPVYLALDFDPVVRSGGDALARMQVRVDELAGSVSLTAAALDRLRHGQPAPQQTVSPGRAELEGPRGPISANRRDDRRQVRADSQVAAIELAGGLVIGTEWATALLVLASLDLSPWQVGA